jgi:hypothetical protein
MPFLVIALTENLGYLPVKLVGEIEAGALA